VIAQSDPGGRGDLPASSAARSRGGAHPAEVAGFSLLELLVAVTCTLLLAGAVFSLMEGSARAGRRRWGEVAAGTVARAAVASVAEDLAAAGRGVEHADSVQRNGVVIRRASSDPVTALRAVLPAGPVAEIWGHVGASTYLVVAGGAPRIGTSVAAVDQPLRPVAAPLPAGVVVGATRIGAMIELSVAWYAPEAAVVASWGLPRALAPVFVRSYEVRRLPGGLQLRRRDDGGSWQPIADGIDAFDVYWILDTDGDGVPDTRRSRWLGGAGSRACAVQLEARVRSPATRLVGGPAAATKPVVARRWIRLEGC
jgi:type II secretory pathway pseudopilin PulG